MCESLVYRGKAIGTPGGARTPNPLIRSQVLCPIELRVHNRVDDYSDIAHQSKQIINHDIDFQSTCKMMQSPCFRVFNLDLLA